MILRDKLRQNDYLYFGYKLILLLIIVFILDFSIGKVLKYYYFKQEFGRQYRASYTINKTTADILVFGSSKAYHHYVPDIIEEKFKKSCYNTGSPGQFLLYNYATLQAVLKRYTPKLIILDVSPGDLKIERESYERLASLLPYYKDHEEIHPIVNLKSPYEKYKLLSSIYAFNSSFLMIAGGNTSYLRARSKDIKGFKPLNRIWNDSIEIRRSQPYEIDSVKMDVFLSFINDCKLAGSKLLIVCSPAFIEYHPKDYSLSIFEKISKEQNIEFIDFTNDSTFINHPNLFDDPGHLNFKGAKLFTTNFISRIDHSIKFQ